MAEINAAYQANDEERLRQILANWQNSPEAIKETGIGADLIRLVRKIAHIKVRIAQIKAEFASFQESDLYQIKNEVAAAAKAGRDLLVEMAKKVEAEIAVKRKKLADLTRKS
jgi:hypothetical protein